MARLDDDVMKSLFSASDKLDERTKKQAAKPKHIDETLRPTPTYDQQHRPFSEVFGFDPPSGIDHAVPVFDPSDWHPDVREFIPQVDPLHIHPPKETEKAVVAIIRGNPLLVTGKKGSGKTTMQKQIAAHMRLPWFRVNCNLDITSSSFFGTPDMSKGELGWTDGPLPLFGQHGGLCTIDEVSACPAGIALALQSPLEPGGAIYIPDKPKGHRYLQPHKWFRLGGTDNTKLQGDTTGRYAGTNVQNEALIDRFLVSLKLDYLSREHESAVLLSRVPNLPTEWLDKMLDIASFIRRGYDNGDLNFTLSPRGLIAWASESVYWGNLAEGFTDTFLNKLTEEDERQVVEIFLKVTAVDLNKGK